MMNPLMLVRMLRSNPQDLMNTIMSSNDMMKNPMFKNGMDMYQKGDTEGLTKLVNNLAKQRGTSVEEMRKQLGI